jgi:hypothetical protein
MALDTTPMKNPRTVTISFDVTFDADVTNSDFVAEAMDTLITTAMNTTGILEDCGNVEVGDVEVAILRADGSRL